MVFSVFKLHTQKYLDAFCMWKLKTSIQWINKLYELVSFSLSFSLFWIPHRMLHAYLYHINIINEERKKNEKKTQPEWKINEFIWSWRKNGEKEEKKREWTAKKRWRTIGLANKQAKHTATFYKVHNMILSHDTRYTPMSRCVGNTLERNLPLLGWTFVADVVASLSLSLSLCLFLPR